MTLKKEKPGLLSGSFCLLERENEQTWHFADIYVRVFLSRDDVNY